MALDNLAFEAIKNLLIQSLTVPENLEDVAAYVKNLISKPMMGNQNSTKKLEIDYELVKAFDKASSVIKNNMSSFYPISNRCGAISSGFAALSQAITGTTRLEYHLIMRVFLYFCENKDEMVDLMQKLIHRFPNMVISFEDEVKKCFMKNANYLTWYALSRMLRCTINIWVVYYNESKGSLDIRLNKVPPPQMNTFEKIDILELIDGPSKNYRLLKAKKPPGPEALLGDDNTSQKVSCT